MTSPLSRRTVLRGLGVSMALPWLDAMARATPLAAAQGLPAGAGALGGGVPTRIAFVFMPNGVNYDWWGPTGSGAGYRLSRTLEPIDRVREHVTIITGLTLDKARANGDGPGDHARSSASFLTGHQARKTAGNDIRIGVSVDQFAARQVGQATRLPSIELGCEHSPSAGNCDSGYSCAYTSNISWRSEDTPMPKLVDPGAAFERLFGDVGEAAHREERLARRQSVLDFVLGEARSLEAELGVEDRRKLDQYQTSVREVERRIEAARREDQARPRPDMPAPQGIPARFSEHVDLMYDLLLLAFQTDTTRIGTLMLGVDGSNRVYPEIGVKEGHHHLSHHQNNQAMIDGIRKIDRFHVERFTRFIERLARTPDGEGMLIDHSMILFGGGISDGNRHNHEDLPILLAGRAGGQIDPGRLIRAKRETPLCNLYESMLDRMGCDVESFGDSTGRLGDLTL
ncbi:MAG: DUF1552 domain-containing protein [Phycisphaerales bacterium]|nr:DUF1552 domain-containing protein [Phycisphaerales bacterium]